jgi:hypothetical protein
MKSLMVICLSSRVPTILWLTVQSLLGTILLQEILLKTPGFKVGYQAKAEEAVVTKYCAAYPPMNVITDKAPEGSLKANGTAKDLVLGKPQKVNLYCPYLGGYNPQFGLGSTPRVFTGPITIEPFQSSHPDQLKIFKLFW